MSAIGETAGGIANFGMEMVRYLARLVIPPG